MTQYDDEDEAVREWATEAPTVPEAPVPMAVIADEYSQKWLRIELERLNGEEAE